MFAFREVEDLLVKAGEREKRGCGDDSVSILLSRKKVYESVKQVGEPSF